MLCLLSDNILVHSYQQEIWSGDYDNGRTVVVQAWTQAIDFLRGLLILYGYSSGYLLVL